MWERAESEELGSQTTETSTLPRHRRAEAGAHGVGVGCSSKLLDKAKAGTWHRSARTWCWGLRVGWGPEGWLGALAVAA